MLRFDSEINNRSQLPRNAVNSPSFEVIKSQLFEEAGGPGLQLTGEHSVFCTIQEVRLRDHHQHSVKPVGSTAAFPWEKRKEG